MRTPQQYLSAAARKLDIHQDQLKFKLYISSSMWPDRQGSFELTDSWTSWCKDEAELDIKGLFAPIHVTLHKRIGNIGNEYWPVIHQFKLSPFPDCCGIVISHAANTDWNHRNKGLNTLFNQLRRELAATFGYATVLCTDVENNEPERKTLKRAGFVDTFFFDNKRTKNRIVISACPV